MSIPDLWGWLSANATNVIAICALAATFWQSYLARQHNRISVKPHLEIASGFNFNDQYFFINILNNGIGPALITKIQLLIDDVEVDSQKSEVFTDVISNLFHMYKYKENYFVVADSYMMKPNEEKTYMKVELLESFVEFPVTNSEEMEQIRSRIKVFISYESMYGEKFKCP